MAYRCIVFDFDGTLADTLQETMVILNELAAEYGFRRMEKHHVHDAKRMTVGQFARFLGIPSWKVPRLLTKGKRRLTERLETIQPFEGIPDALNELKPHVDHLGILTSNSVKNVEFFAENHGLVDFAFVMSCKKLMGKARYLKAIAKTHRISPREILYVGDEIRDIEAANRAKVPVAAVTWGFNAPDALEEAVPDYLISDPAELVRIVRG